MGLQPETPAGATASLAERLWHWPRLTLAVAYASWWWWVWVPWSEQFHVTWELWATLLPFVLVLFGAFATASASRRHRRLVCTALLTSPAVGVPAVLAVNATRAFAAGNAELMVGGYPWDFSPYGRIDAETRIPHRGSGCMGPPLYAPIHNGTLLVLDAVIGPMPGTYQGPLPSRAEAQHALDDRAVDVPSACHNHVLSVGGLSASFDPDDDPVCGWAEPNDGAPHRMPRRVAAINDDLIAIEDRWTGEPACDPPEAPCPIRMIHVGSGRTLGSPPRDDEHRPLVWRTGLSGSVWVDVPIADGGGAAGAAR